MPTTQDMQSALITFNAIEKINIALKYYKDFKHANVGFRLKGYSPSVSGVQDPDINEFQAPASLFLPMLEALKQQYIDHLASRGYTYEEK